MLYNGTPEVGEEPYTSVDQPLDLAAGVWEQPPVDPAQRTLIDAYRSAAIAVRAVTEAAKAAQPVVRAASPDRRLFDAMSAKIAALEQQVTQQQEYLVSSQNSVAMPVRLSTNTTLEDERHALNKHYGNRCDCTWCLSRGFDLRQGAWLERTRKMTRAEHRSDRRKAWNAYWTPDARMKVWLALPFVTWGLAVIVLSLLP